MGDSGVYQRNVVKIPTPAYYVLYIGEEKQPEKQDLYLSDAFLEPTKGYEWTAHFLNINPGFNIDLLESCPALKGFAVAIDKIRRKCKQGMLFEAAVDTALEECILEGYLPALQG